MTRKSKSPWTTLRPKSTAGDERREIKFYGTAACQALWERRPQDIIRVYVQQELVNRFGALLKWAAAQRKAYHIVEDDDLSRLCDSIHHQGICVLAKEHERISFAELKAAIRNHEKPVNLVYLDGVENPHNLGAIIRTCAHFGVEFILGAAGQLPKISPSACRVAEGGAEYVRLAQLNNPMKQLQELKSAGFELIASAAGGEPLFTHVFTQSTVLIMGAEQAGVSKSIQSLAHHTLAIPGSGAVESMNVAAAFAVCAAEIYRQQHH